MKLKEFANAPFYGICNYHIAAERMNDNIILLDTAYPEIAEFGDEYNEVINKYGNCGIISVDFSGEQLHGFIDPSIYVDILIKGQQ